MSKLDFTRPLRTADCRQRHLRYVGPDPERPGFHVVYQLTSARYFAVHENGRPALLSDPTVENVPQDTVYHLGIDFAYDRQLYLTSDPDAPVKLRLVMREGKPISIGFLP